MKPYRGRVSLYQKVENNNQILVTLNGKKQIHTYWSNNKTRHQKRTKSNQQVLNIIKKESSCALCGYSKYIEALDFHHIMPQDKKYRISGKHMSKKDIAKEIQKCIVLCANCHRHITQKEKNSIEEIKWGEKVIYIPFLLKRL